ncbi:MAG TPA: MgtC/SapB family protein [Burkholderiaceae bacterium]|nr:MgtC/SapB family protein [Burkholderiaceae bacterium]
MPVLDWHYAVLQHLLAALCAGGLIGLERSFHGRPAGFRTHALVCMSSSVLMLITVYQSLWYTPSGPLTLDPTRMAQGIMTGIGFLGAGVIMRDGLSVRGLTTAASIWLTAGIGVLAGVGLYGAMVLATMLALGVLSVFRWVERKLPVERHARLVVRFDSDDIAVERELLTLLDQLGFAYGRVRGQVDRGARSRTMELTVNSRDIAAHQQLAESLERMRVIAMFEIVTAE